MSDSEFRVVKDNVEVGPDVTIGTFSRVGVPFRLVDGDELDSRPKTKLRQGTEIRSYVTLCKGTEVGANTTIDDYCKVEQDVNIGRECFVIYRSQICNDAKVGDNCVVAGFIGERSKLEDGVRVFGSLVHRQDNPKSDWDDAIEPSPVIEANAFVGWGATIIGGVTIGENSYVAAGAVVTNDIPPNTIVYGINQLGSPEEWKGQLSKSEYFKK